MRLFKLIFLLGFFPFLLLSCGDNTEENNPNFVEGSTRSQKPQSTTRVVQETTESTTTLDIKVTDETNNNKTSETPDLSPTPAQVQAQGQTQVVNNNTTINVTPGSENVEVVTETIPVKASTSKEPYQYPDLPFLFAVEPEELTFNLDESEENCGKILNVSALPEGLVVDVVSPISGFGSMEELEDGSVKFRIQNLDGLRYVFVVGNKGKDTDFPEDFDELDVKQGQVLAKTTTDQFLSLQIKKKVTKNGVEEFKARDLGMKISDDLTFEVSGNFNDDKFPCPKTKKAEASSQEAPAEQPQNTEDEQPTNLIPAYDYEGSGGVLLLDNPPDSTDN